VVVVQEREPTVLGNGCQSGLGSTLCHAIVVAVKAGFSDSQKFKYGHCSVCTDGDKSYL